MIAEDPDRARVYAGIGGAVPTPPARPGWRRDVADGMMATTMAEKSSRKAAKGARKRTATRPATKPVRLLSGGNPQIAKADGDAPVQEIGRAHV